MAVDHYFAAYAAYHRDRRNKTYHYVGVPMITFAVLNFCYQIPALEVGGVSIDWALVLVAVVSAWYLTLSVRLALAMLLLVVPVYGLARVSPWEVGLGFFVVGWVLQLIGHHYEGKKPAFLKNGLHLFVGPLWIVSLLLESLRRPRAEAVGQTSP